MATGGITSTYIRLAGGNVYGVFIWHFFMLLTTLRRHHRHAHESRHKRFAKAFQLAHTNAVNAGISLAVIGICSAISIKVASLTPRTAGHCFHRQSIYAVCVIGEQFAIIVAAERFLHRFRFGATIRGTASCKEDSPRSTGRQPLSVVGQNAGQYFASPGRGNQLADHAHPMFMAFITAHAKTFSLS